MFALFKEVLKREKRKKRKLNTGAAINGAEDSDEDGSSELNEDEDDDTPVAPQRMHDKVKDSARNAPERELESVPTADKTVESLSSAPSGNDKIHPERSV